MLRRPKSNVPISPDREKRCPLPLPKMENSGLLIESAMFAAWDLKEKSVTQVLSPRSSLRDLIFYYAINPMYMIAQRPAEMEDLQEVLVKNASKSMAVTRNDMDMIDQEKQTGTSILSNLVFRVGNIMYLLPLPVSARLVTTVSDANFASMDTNIDPCFVTKTAIRIAVLTRH